MKLTLRSTSGPLPTSTFDLVDDAGNVLGFCQVRHRPSHNADLPPEAGNNVYYEIDEACRGHGLGKELLGLALQEAKRLGLDRVRLTVREDNPISRHIIADVYGAQHIGTFTDTKGAAHELFEIVFPTKE
jgi:predicted acetyltransferase